MLRPFSSLAALAALVAPGLVRQARLEGVPNAAVSLLEHVLHFERAHEDSQATPDL